MARIFSIGFEVASNSLADNYPLTGGSPTSGYCPGRTGFGRAFAVSRPTGSMYVMGGSPASTTYVTQYERFYIRIRRLPTTGKCRVWSNFTDTGGNSLKLDLKTDGTLELLNVAHSLGTTAALTLGQWYRLEIRATCNTATFAAPDPPLEDNSLAELKIDGTVAINAFPTNNGVSLLGLATRNCKVYRSYLGAEGLLADAEYDLDDWVADTAAYPGPGQVTLVRPNGAGSLQEWPGDWRRLAPCPGSVTPITDGLTTTTASARESVTLESWAERNITGTIHAAQIHAFIRSGATIPALGFSVNGGGFDWANTLAGGNEVFTARYLASPGFTVANTVEIGYRKDGSATAHYLNHLSLLVDHDSPDPPAPSDDTIRTTTGTYTGNGTGQTITLAFEPDFLMIRKIGASGIGLIWFRRMGDRGAYATGTDGMGVQGGSTRLALVRSTGFDVCHDLETNASGAVYWYLAIRDQTGRMLNTGGFFPAPSIDDQNISLGDVTFTPEVLMVLEQFNSSTGDVYFRGPAHVGDLSSPISSATGAPVANAIQSVGAGTFQVGTILTVSPAQRTYAAFKSGAFVTNRLLAVSSYVGTGVGVGNFRDIPLNLGGRTPTFVLIVPHNAGGNRYFKTDLNATEDAQNWRTGAVQPTHAIKTLAADSATVGYLLDTLGVTFTVWAISNGADAATIPEETFPDSWSGDTIALLWAELALDSGTRVYSKVDLPDPASYYGGFKQARILTAGAIKRALSDRMGNYEAAQFGLTFSDADRVIRGLLASEPSIYNRFVTLRMISDAGRRALLTPRVVGIGYLRDYAPISPLQFSLTCEDYLAIFVGLGQNEKQVPKRTITETDFEGCPATVIGRPVPVIYGNLSDSGSSEGPVANVTAAEVTKGYRVTGLAAFEGAAGTLTGGKTYKIRVTAVGDDGIEYDGINAGTADDVSEVSITPVGGSVRPVFDATIQPPEMVGMHHVSGAGSFTKYRWGLVTALKQVAGIWYESDQGGWGDVHGDEDPNLCANAMLKVLGTPDRIRLYVFNVNDFGPLGFHPTLNPDPPVGVAGDPATPRIVRVIEADLAGVVYSAKTGGRPDSAYTGPASASFGDPGATHFLQCYGDADGDDFTLATGGVSIDLNWDAWVPPSGVALSKYRVYWHDGSEWRQFDSAIASTSITSPTQGTQVSGGSYYYAVTAVFGGDQTVPSVEALGSYGPKVTRTGVRIAWSPLQGADSYYVYRRPLGGGADVSQLYNRRWSVTGKSWVIDDLADTDAEVIDGIPKAQGILPVTYVGDVTLSGAKWKRFLVCGHAVKEITAVYQKDASEDEYIQVEPGNFGTDFLAPGFSGWSSYFATDYQDVNGRRYTFIHARGPRGDAAAEGTRPLRVNVRGIEAVGDGTGDLIEDGFLQYLHAMRNWILQDYQTGAWFATGPTWPSSFSLPATEVLDDQSFADASAVAATWISGGYKGAFVMGADAKQDTVRTWIQRFNLSLDAFAGFSRKSQFFVRVIDTRPDVLSAARQFTQLHDIVAESFKISDRPADLENVVSYNFGRNYATGGWKYDTREVSDAASIADNLQTKKSQTIDLWLAPTSIQALDVASRRLLRTKETPRTVVFTTGLQAVNTELGDVIRVTHTEGIGANGWTNRAIFVIRHELSPDGLSITLEGIDVDRLFTGGFVLGDETALAASWAAADAADRLYGYLCDETTGLFSDGADGKRLR